MKPPVLNCEDWLTQLVENLRPHIQQAGYALPEIKISYSWPSTRALSLKKRRIGECWSYKASGNGVTTVFISPVLELPLEVAEVVVHELGHAALPDAGHKGPFRAYMRAVGLIGKPTATVAGTQLTDLLKTLTDALGPYPNGRLDKTMRPSKKQSVRMLKVACGQDHAPYVLRGARATLEKGIPECPVCGADMEVEEPEETEGE